MKTFEETRQIAYDVLDNESQAIANLKNHISEGFYESVKAIYHCNGRVIITGIGKSAIIANKIVATLNSTGTRAIFMHAADAVHGDLGMIQEDDLVICISKSGNTPEIKVLVPILKRIGNLLIGMVGNRESYLAQHANYILDTTIMEEACPNNLAPTTSTTAQLVMGDALAVCLIEIRGFDSKDFARYHPGGSLGKKLYLRMADIYPQNPKPEVDVDAPLKNVIVEITSHRLGAVVVTKNGSISGMITDGDIRRMLEKNVDLSEIRSRDIMSRSPKTIDQDALAVRALEMMRELKISQVIVTANGKYAGMVHIHDLNREGLI